MQLLQSIPPHFRRRDGVRDISLVLLLACAALHIPAVISYGARAVLMTLAGALGALVAEGMWCFFSNKEQTVGDLTAVSCGVICSMLIPVECPVWAPLLAAAFAVCAAKLPFGGPGRSVFCPAAIGGCFALLCWGNFKHDYDGSRDTALYQNLASYCYGYTEGSLPLLGSIDTASAKDCWVSPLVQLSAGQQNTVSSSDAIAAVCDPGLSATDFLLSDYPGSLGVASAILVLLCAVFLSLFGCCAWRSSLGFTASVAVLSLIFPYSAVPVWQSPLYDLFTGSTLFAAVFLAGDIMSAPHTHSARFMYGLCGGALTVLLRRIGAVECCELFAVALMGPLSSAIDQMAWDFRQKGVSFTALRKGVSRRLRRLLRIKPGPFDSFDEEDDGYEV